MRVNDMPDKIPGDEYVLHMDAETASVVALACELYSRLRCGQFQEARYLTLRPIGPDDKTFSQRIQDCENALETAKKAAFPELVKNASYGVGHFRDADTAWNVYQAVRYIKAWHDHPEGGNMVNFNTPMKFSDAPMPRCEVRDGDMEWRECFVDPRTGDLVDTDAAIKDFTEKYGD